MHIGYYACQVALEFAAEFTRGERSRSDRGYVGRDDEDTRDKLENETNYRGNAPQLCEII